MNSLPPNWESYCLLETPKCNPLAKPLYKCKGCGKTIPHTCPKCFDATFAIAGPCDKCQQEEQKQQVDPTSSGASKPTSGTGGGTVISSGKTAIGRAEKAHDTKKKIQPSSGVTSTKVAASAKPARLPANVSSKLSKAVQNYNSSQAAPHVQLKALAGTGKTSSCIEGLKSIKGITPSFTPSPQQEEFWKQLGIGKSATVRLSAFNTTITDEMRAKCKDAGLDKIGCEARGVHSLGLQIVTQHFGRMDLNSANFVVKDIIAKCLGGEYKEMRKQPGNLALMSAADEVVSLCKQNLIEPEPQAIDKLVSHYGVDVEDVDRERLYNLVPEVIEACKQPEGRIAFDDMVWLPVVHNLPVPKVDVQIIDEAQDLNRMQQELIYKAGRRVVFVGDPHQAIYGFAGADSESMPNMARHLSGSELGCIELPLTVTRRCGKRIVTEAQGIVPEYEAHESNGLGLVGELKYPMQGSREDRHELPWEQTYGPYVRDGAMIICRCNAPVVSQCFKLIKQGMKANILGRDIGKGLEALVDKAKVDTVVDLTRWLADWLDRESAKEHAKKIPDDNRLIALQDKADCVLCFAEDCTYVNEVKAKIASVFTDNKHSPGIRLSSIHKAKGLEAKQVFFLQPQGAECPHPMAKKAWEITQEKNLRYVAITRAIEELYHVY